MSEHPGEFWYRLSPNSEGRGLICDRQGVFVGPVPLLALVDASAGEKRWVPRPVSQLDAELGACYGIPVATAAKAGGLHTIARALNRGDLAMARIATVQLRMPDLPPLATPVRSVQDDLTLIQRLHHSGMLALNWNPHLHPRWPAGASDSQGGQFRPADSDAAAGDFMPLSDEDTAQVIPLPLPVPIPAPFELPMPPTEITPFPFTLPDGMRREPFPVNPYPDRPECEEEWSYAYRECKRKMEEAKLRSGRSGFGKDFAACVRGMVSQDCGGNPIA